jgi:hypothetical protein
VLPWWEGADEAQSRCSFSNLIRYARAVLQISHVTASDSDSEDAARQACGKAAAAPARWGIAQAVTVRNFHSECQSRARGVRVGHWAPAVTVTGTVSVDHCDILPIPPAAGPSLPGSASESISRLVTCLGQCQSEVRAPCRQLTDVLL